MSRTVKSGSGYEEALAVPSVSAADTEWLLERTRDWSVKQVAQWLQDSYGYSADHALTYARSLFKEAGRSEKPRMECSSEYALMEALGAALGLVAKESGNDSLHGLTGEVTFRVKTPGKFTEVAPGVTIRTPPGTVILRGRYRIQ